MSNLADFHVGDEVLVVTEDIGRATKEMLPVTKVGRKYVTVGSGILAHKFAKPDNGDMHFRLDGDYSAACSLYKSESDYNDDIEYNKLYDWFLNFKLWGHGVSLDSLRKVKEILEPDKEI